MFTICATCLALCILLSDVNCYDNGPPYRRTNAYQEMLDRIHSYIEERGIDIPYDNDTATQNTNPGNASEEWPTKYNDEGKSPGNPGSPSPVPVSPSLMPKASILPTTQKRTLPPISMPKDTKPPSQMPGTFNSSPPMPVNPNSPSPLPGRPNPSVIPPFPQSFHCPILREVLMKRIKNFPTTYDMTGTIHYSQDFFLPLVTKVMALLERTREPEIASTYLMKRLTKIFVDMRLTCATAKFEQVLIYAVSKEIESTFKTDSLFGKIKHVLDNFPNRDRIANGIVSELNKQLFYHTLETIYEEEFEELGSLMEMFYTFTEKELYSYLNGNLMPHSHTEFAKKFMASSRPFFENKPCLQCTSVATMKYKHARIANYTQSKYYNMESTGYLHAHIRFELENIARETIGEEWRRMNFPFDSITRYIIDYTTKVISEVKKYTYRLYSSPMVNLQKMFARYLEPYQLTAFREILHFMQNREMQGTNTDLQAMKNILSKSMSVLIDMRITLKANGRVMDDRMMTELERIVEQIKSVLRSK